jgi:peptidoglycan/LPS O-acetylase OafA/YrhL
MDYRDDKSWPLNHLWSLSVEEQFYFLWGALFVLTSQFRLRIAVILLALLPLGVRCCYLFGVLPTSNPVATARQFECVVDALAIGALLSVFFNTWMRVRWIAEFANSKKSFWLGNALTLAAVASYLVNTKIYDSIGQSIANVGLTLVLWHCITVPKGFVGRLLNWRPIVFIGVLSYSLYLWQQLFLNPNSRSFYASFPVNVCLSFCAALISYYIIERPFLRARRYFRARDSAAIAKHGPASHGAES